MQLNKEFDKLYVEQINILTIFMTYYQFEITATMLP